jgi:hypothetical protein
VAGGGGIAVVAQLGDERVVDVAVQDERPNDLATRDLAEIAGAAHQLDDHRLEAHLDRLADVDLRRQQLEIQKEARGEDAAGPGHRPSGGIFMPRYHGRVQVEILGERVGETLVPRAPLLPRPSTGRRTPCSRTAILGPCSSWSERPVTSAGRSADCCGT